MVTTSRFRELALSLDGVVESTHFDKASFRVKKIFATLDERTGIATFKFSLVDQSVFLSFGKGAIYEVPNKWGKQGWTMAELDKLPEDIVQDALETSYREAVKKKR